MTGMTKCNLEFIAVGGNRHPSAADWAPGILAFGAGYNIALWDPDDDTCKGVTTLITGHTDIVNSLKIYDSPEGRLIISGSADRTIRVWTSQQGVEGFEQVQCLREHVASINTISVLPQCHLFITGSADGILKTWSFSGLQATALQTISLKPHFIPLTSALIELEDGTIVLAVAGTSTLIQLYVRSKSDAGFALQATLAGHESWIRSLDFVKTQYDSSSDLMLSSASQDKYIRLWRFHKGSDVALDTTNTSIQNGPLTIKKSLSNKTQQVGMPSEKYNVTFEALLIGHEDWVYSARWAPSEDKQSPKLLSASADNSLAIWQADQSSGVWICNTRLGEISAQKGSTTATGSTGGFWIGLWQPRGQGIVCLGRTGSWRRWKHAASTDMWLQQPGIGGHTQEVRSLAWCPDGSYLISTSSDQTTRLYAEWKRSTRHSWHEFSRPQIHGYDLNCIDTLSQSQFISGADEKLLRVFNKPKAISKLMTRLCGMLDDSNDELSDAANIPVLGLSNKAVTTASDEQLQVNGTMQNDADGNDAFDPSSIIHTSTLELDHPPFEEHLSRHTLWPEHEKLYGHGYEISAVSASSDGSLVASACKASSLEHAVIRIYECRQWREVKPALSAHNLTVTSLAFSPNDNYILSVGRDRQWALFAKDAENGKVFKRLITNPKGHARMILDCSWAPTHNQCVFATAGRDKTVKIWKRTPNAQVECTTTITEKASVTAVAFQNSLTRESFRLALGTEYGCIRIVDVARKSLEVASSFEIPANLLPSGAVNSLQWRPTHSDATFLDQLAAGSDDASVRIFNFGT